MAPTPARRKKFTPENRVAVIKAVARGATLKDAAAAADLNAGTVDNWLARGRKDDDGDYYEFSQVIDGLRGDKLKAEPMTEEELREVVSITAQAGNVQAQRLYYEMLRDDKAPDEDEPEVPADKRALGGLDELAARRQSKAAQK